MKHFMVSFNPAISGISRLTVYVPVFKWIECLSEKRLLN